MHMLGGAGTTVIVEHLDVQPHLVDTSLILTGLPACCDRS